MVNIIVQNEPHTLGTTGLSEVRIREKQHRGPAWLGPGWADQGREGSEAGEEHKQRPGRARSVAQRCGEEKAAWWRRHMP